MVESTEVNTDNYSEVYVDFCKIPSQSHFKKFSTNCPKILLKIGVGIDGQCKT